MPVRGGRVEKATTSAASDTVSSPGDYFERVNNAVEAVLSGQLTAVEASQTFNVLKATVLYKVRLQQDSAVKPPVAFSSDSIDVPAASAAPPEVKPRTKRPGPASMTNQKLKRVKNESVAPEESTVQNGNELVQEKKKPSEQVPATPTPQYGTRQSSRSVKKEPIADDALVNGKDGSVHADLVRTPTKPVHFPLASGTKIPRKSAAGKQQSKDNNHNQPNFHQQPDGAEFVVTIPHAMAVSSLVTVKVDENVEQPKEVKAEQQETATSSSPQINLPKTDKDPGSMLNEFLKRQAVISTLSPRPILSPQKMGGGRKMDRKRLSSVEAQLKAVVDQLCSKCSRIQKENISQCLLDAGSQKADTTRLIRLARLHNAPLVHVKNCWAHLHPPVATVECAENLLSSSSEPVEPASAVAIETKSVAVEMPPVNQRQIIVQEQAPLSTIPPSPVVTELKHPIGLRAQKQPPRVLQSRRKTALQPMEMPQPPPVQSAGDKEANTPIVCSAVIPPVNASPLSGLMKQIVMAEAEGTIFEHFPAAQTASGSPSVQARKPSKAMQTPFLKWFTEEKKKICPSGFNGFQRNLIIQQLKEKWENMPQQEKDNWGAKPKPLIPSDWRERIRERQEPQMSAQTPSTSSAIKRQRTPAQQPRLKSARPAADVFNSLSLVDKKRRWALDSSFHKLHSRPATPVRSIEADALEVAGHFRILGQTMTRLAGSLLTSQQTSSTDASLDLLMDAFFCSLGPLTAVTQYVAEMNGSQEGDVYEIVNNSAVLMPL